MSTAAAKRKQYAEAQNSDRYKKSELSATKPRAPKTKEKDRSQGNSSALPVQDQPVKRSRTEKAPRVSRRTRTPETTAKEGPELATSMVAFSDSAPAAKRAEDPALREHIAEIKQAINLIATGAANPLGLAVFKKQSPVSEVLSYTVKRFARLEQTEGFSRAQIETFVYQLNYRLGLLLDDCTRNGDPELEKVRTIIESLAPTFEAYSDLLNG